MLSVLLGVFLFAGVAAASDADVLQPASTITYNEDLTVNGTGTFNSVKIGKQGEGGVTFFQGTIINTTTGEGGNDNPVTFGDNVRIDGEIYRIQKGEDPIKISDNVIPTLTNVNNFGSSSNRWNNIYGKNINLSNNLYVAGVITGKTSVTVDDDLFVNDSIRLSGGYTHGGTTISEGMVKTDGGIVINDDSAGGSINFLFTKNGTDMFKIRGDGTTHIGGPIENENGIAVEFNNMIKVGKITGPQSCLSGADAGKIYFNGSNSRFYGCNGTSWVPLDN